MKFRIKARARVEFSPASLNVMFRAGRKNIFALLIRAEDGTLDISMEHFHDDHHGFVVMEEHNGVWECPLCDQTVVLKPFDSAQYSTSTVLYNSIGKDSKDRLGGGVA